MASKSNDGPASKRPRVDDDGSPAAHRVIRIGNCGDGEAAVVAKLAGVLVDGKVIAVPTDTM